MHKYLFTVVTLFIMISKKEDNFLNVILCPIYSVEYIIVHSIKMKNTYYNIESLLLYRKLKKMITKHYLEQGLIL